MLRVLVVDDSLFMRRLVTDLLQSDPDVGAVETAKDGGEAVTKIQKFRPDVITLDLAMPGLSGPDTLRKIMATHPTPVVLLSAYSREGAEVTLECLAAGAIGFVPKPSGELSLDIDSVRDTLLREVKTAASCDMHRRPTQDARRRTQGAGRKTRDARRLIVIGASTGGPQTLERVLAALPHRFPVPIVIAQHLPTPMFTQSLVQRLDQRCALHVREAHHGDPIAPGNIYLIPPHMRAELNAQIHLVAAPAGTDEEVVVSPSIDATMQSAAAHYRGGAVGVILTGMGRDGVEGIRAIRAHGGRSIVENHSALLFGMPQQVIEAGLADTILPAGEIAAEIVRCVSASRDNPEGSSDADRNNAKN